MQKTLHCFLLNSFYFPGCHTWHLKAIAVFFILVGRVKAYVICLTFDSHPVQQVSRHDYTEMNVLGVSSALCNRIVYIFVCFNRSETRHSPS